jgi:hypothetical protein
VHGKLTNRSHDARGFNWIRHLLVVALALASLPVGIYYPALRIPFVVTAAVTGCVIGLMRYRWYQRQYWVTIAVLVPLLALFNFRVVRVAESQWVLMFPLMIGELAFSAVVIIRICPAPKDYD